MKATQACALFLLILLLCPLAAQAGTLGPALSYNEWLGLVRQSLLVVGDSVSHARVVNCLLQDGENTFSYDTVITPLPEITSSVETVDPLLTPTPELTPEPTPEHTHAPQPTPEPSFTPIPATPDEASPAE